MAKARYIRPIESLSGKLKKSDQVGYAMRSKSKAKFTVTRDDWKMVYTTAAKEQAAVANQTKFAAVVRLARARMIDPTKMADDAVAFRNQSKYTTMFGYLFVEEWNNYQG